MGNGNNKGNGNDMMLTAKREELLAQMIAVQSKEVDCRLKELEFRKQGDAHSFEFSKAALAVQADDAKDDRKHRRFTTVVISIVATIIIVSIIAFMTYCIVAGKEQVAMEIIKSAIFLLSGGAGGYAIGARKRAASQENESPEQEVE